MSIFSTDDPLFYDKNNYVSEITKVVTMIDQKVSVWRYVGMKGAAEARSYQDNSSPAGAVMLRYMELAGIDAQEAARRLIAHDEYILGILDFAALYSARVWELCPVTDNEELMNLSNSIIGDGYSVAFSVVGSPFEYIPPAPPEDPPA